MFNPQSSWIPDLVWDVSEVFSRVACLFRKTIRSKSILSDHTHPPRQECQSLPSSTRFRFQTETLFHAHSHQRPEWKGGNCLWLSILTLVLYVAAEFILSFVCCLWLLICAGHAVVPILMMLLSLHDLCWCYCVLKRFGWSQFIHRCGTCGTGVFLLLFSIIVFAHWCSAAEPMWIHLCLLFVSFFSLFQGQMKLHLNLGVS